MNAPTQIRQGLTYAWVESNSDYPASASWACKAYIAGPSALLTLTAVADGDDFDFTLTAAQSAALSTGTYQIQVRFEHATTGNFTPDGYINSAQVLPGLNTQVAGYEARSHPQIVLDALNALIEGRATNVQKSMAIGGKAAEFLTLEELITAKLKYERFVENEKSAEQVKKGLKSGKSVGVRFVNP
jgi:hypothetical protein